ncbi:acyl-CoA thioesterase YbgC [Tritonibacter multivorans]|uniref:Acyl-CoA thioesterase YbgC n=1 Tax=Tritonibacter multivorans TaxID=928856 RepID=A0A0P1GG29_9RHOB|nr:thioesterase family protein [Tritonibacter multivorans]MDA7422913.1 thioesterase family protein [Tritonibacter multivorans]CUH74695.1 acyl-CoA thioesterase YbgC [Tritonibacter multivorans]SFD76024.1 4-hydroxybenzoyl-CoA thioesterase [Tritonibacter multivorans]
MHSTLRQKILFKHCDPAGIVFYPRYFEMINDAVEAMFADVLDWPFEDLHQTGAVPTASFQVDFKAPSRHGDVLDLNLTIKAIGGASLRLQIVAQSGEEVRFVADQVLVCIDQNGRPLRWPDAIRAKIDKEIGDPL